MEVLHYKFKKYILKQILLLRPIFNIALILLTDSLPPPLRKIKCVRRKQFIKNKNKCFLLHVNVSILKDRDIYRFFSINDNFLILLY